MRVACIVCLVCCFLGQLILRFSPQEHFSVMPIFTPVSLQYEKQMRGGEQPLNIRQAMRILERLEQQQINGKVQEQDLLALQKTRLQMLEYRNRRHELNIEMMHLAVEVVQVLNQQQWEVIQSQRDAIQAKIELQTFDNLLRKLQQK
jgi:hypothetical protein